MAEVVATTKPKRVWKPPAKTDGAVPSLFASATLKKPLKVNTAVATTIRSKRPSTTTTTKPKPKTTPTPSEPSPAPTPTPAPAAPAVVVTAEKPKPEPTPKPPAASKPAVVEKKKTEEPPKPKPSKDTKKSDKLVKNGRIIRGEASKAMPSVVGTPQSWPRPHAVPADEKPVIKPKKKTVTITNPPKSSSDKSSSNNKLPPNKGPKLDDSEANFSFDPNEELIPEMYRRKSAKEIEREQQQEIDRFRQAMYELRMEQRAKEEAALQPKDVTAGIANVLEMLNESKKLNEIEVGSDIGSGSEHDEPASSSNAYTKHMESKLAYFKDISNHSVDVSINSDDWNSSDSSDDDDDSTTSWDSDTEGLFKG